MSKDCKVIPRESLTTEHKLLVIDIYIKTWRGGNETIRCSKVRWWNLKGEKIVSFSNKLREKENWNVKDEVYVMCLCDSYARCLTGASGNPYEGGYTQSGLPHLLGVKPVYEGEGWFKRLIVVHIPRICMDHLMSLTILN
jgi:hypothetical protein